MASTEDAEFREQRVARWPNDTAARARPHASGATAEVVADQLLASKDFKEPQFPLTGLSKSVKGGAAAGFNAETRPKAQKRAGGGRVSPVCVLSRAESPASEYESQAEDGPPSFGSMTTTPEGTRSPPPSMYLPQKDKSKGKSKLAAASDTTSVLMGAYSPPPAPPTELDLGLQDMAYVSLEDAAPKPPLVPRSSSLKSSPSPTTSSALTSSSPSASSIIDAKIAATFAQGRPLRQPTPPAAPAAHEPSPKSLRDRKSTRSTPASSPMQPLTRSPSLPQINERYAKSDNLDSPDGEQADRKRRNSKSDRNMRALAAVAKMAKHSFTMQAAAAADVTRSSTPEDLSTADHADDDTPAPIGPVRRFLSESSTPTAASSSAAAAIAAAARDEAMRSLNISPAPPDEPAPSVVPAPAPAPASSSFSSSSSTSPALAGTGAATFRRGSPLLGRNAGPSSASREPASSIPVLPKLGRNSSLAASCPDWELSRNLRQAAAVAAAGAGVASFRTPSRGALHSTSRRSPSPSQDRDDASSASGASTASIAPSDWRTDESLQEWWQGKQGSEARRREEEERRRAEEIENLSSFVRDSRQRVRQMERREAQEKKKEEMAARGSTGHRDDQERMLLAECSGRSLSRPPLEWNDSLPAVQGGSKGESKAEEGDDSSTAAEWQSVWVAPGEFRLMMVEK